MDTDWHGKEVENFSDILPEIFVKFLLHVPAKLSLGMNAQELGRGPQLGARPVPIRKCESNHD